jgi:Ala-tRNA(Pro) deacylase
MNIRDYLESHQVWFETLLHRPAPSASRRAQSVHVPGQKVAKAVLLRAGDGYVLAVLPAVTRVDLLRLSAILEGLPVSLASEDELAGIFGDCERGALPPFGRLYGLRTLVDASLTGGSEIVCLGNLRHEDLRIRYRDYESIERPSVARFAIPTSSGLSGASHRWAG